MAELEALQLKIPPKSRIAITAGSRGIDNLSLVLKSIVKFVKKHGACPFIVPAMGSHGGATAEGQLHVLNQLNITPETVEAPILASMETTVAAHLQNIAVGNHCRNIEFPVRIDKNAFNADGIIVVNRIKPHTAFHGEFESGMLKMLAIGLGKAVQAEKIHGFGTVGLKTLIKPIAEKILGTGKILAGVGLVENAYDKLSVIRAFKSCQIIDGERDLLDIARKLMPSLPVDNFDVLIIEEMGKNLSGTGIDTNVIGRLRIENENEPDTPAIKKIIVLDLSIASAGNAYGIGLADFITKKLFNKISFESTYANVIATGFYERIKIPFVANNEQEAIELAIKSCKLKRAGDAKILKIKNTLNLETVFVSKNLYNEISHRVDRVEHGAC
jgi:hypothetical protein